MNDPSPNDSGPSSPSAPWKRGCLSALLAPVKVLAHNLLLLTLALWQGWSVLVLFWPLWFQSVLEGVYLRDRLGVDPMANPQRVFKAMFTVAWGGFHLMLMTGLMLLSVVALGREADAPGRSWVGALGWIDLVLVLALFYVYWDQHRRRMRNPGGRRARSVKEGVRLLIAPVMKLFPIYLLLVASLNWGEAGIWVFLLAKTLVDLLALPAVVLLRMPPDADSTPSSTSPAARAVERAAS